jgi:transcriptional regulator with XRE-family HTH domain
VSLKVLFGRRLKQLRETKGVTQEQLAEAVGIQVRQVNRIEHGKSGTYFDIVDSMAEFLDVSLEEILDFSKISKEP